MKREKRHKQEICKLRSSREAKQSLIKSTKKINLWSCCSFSLLCWNMGKKRARHQTIGMAISMLMPRHLPDEKLSNCAFKLHLKNLEEKFARVCKKNNRRPPFSISIFCALYSTPVNSTRFSQCVWKIVHFHSSKKGASSLASFLNWSTVFENHSKSLIIWHCEGN